ncbi:methyl-accepting chemotaxis protein [Salinispirillum sp. LH 10-3-1]|uniref:Methyl-accepting chemotaxis protein n=1 Tax=Salinispirillum sp. LH 10-3-1 TaxID=2952525 RepID=A0AB38YBT0_9GAMM
MWNSINVRFNVITISLLTVVLVIYGAIDYRYQMGNEKRRLLQDVETTQRALSLSLPPLLWNFLSSEVEANLAGLIDNPSIQGLYVFEGDQLTSGIRQLDNQEPEAVSTLPEGATIQRFPLIFLDGSNEEVLGELGVEANDRILAEAQQTLITRTVVQILIIDILLAIGIVTLVNRVILSPLYRIGSALKDIASGEGDLTQRIRIRRDDELGRLADHFNQFIDKLHSSMQEVERAANEMNSVTEAVTHSIQTASSEVEQAYGETEQVAAAITEMSQTASEVARNAESATTATNQAEAAATEGQQTLTTTTQSMTTLASDVGKSQGVIQSLRDEVDNIAQIINDIRSIAEQTNLLALNAAIEAARAGDQGRGFAVVADEVRALAARTQASTQDIEAKIAQLIERSDEAVTMMEQSKGASDKTLEHTKLAMTKLVSIAEIMGHIHELTEQTAAAVTEQTQVSENISQNVNIIADGIQRSVESSRKTVERIHALSNSGQALKQMVSAFKL